MDSGPRDLKLASRNDDRDCPSYDASLSRPHVIP
jgi:hypothetical protein